MTALSDIYGYRAHRAEYLEHLYMVNLLNGQPLTASLQKADADLPLDKISEAVAKLQRRKASGVCNISAVLSKARCPAMMCGLIFYSIYLFFNILPFAYVRCFMGLLDSLTHGGEGGRFIVVTIWSMLPT